MNSTLNNIESISAKTEIKFQKWNQTLSHQLQELRDKIAKARHAAEGVKIDLFSLNRQNLLMKQKKKHY